MFAAISLLAITFAVVSAAGSADQCCLQRRVNSVDERGGVYSLDVNLTLIADISSSPVCSSNCIYTKVGKPGQIFCFGQGSLTSECSITPAITGLKRPDFTTIMIGGTVGTKTIGYPCNTSIKDFPEKTKGLSAVVFKDEILVCGGETSVNVEKKCFVERNSSWIQTSSMIMPRSHHTMSAFKDIVVVTGGSHDERISPNNEIEIFNGNTWTKLNKTLTSPRMYHCAVVISETEFYVLGGVLIAYSNGLSIMEKYNNEGNLVAGNLANMTTERFNFGCALLDGKIYAAGGGINSDSMTTMEIYNPSTDKWTLVAGQLGAGTMSNHLVMLNGKLVSYGGGVFSYDAEGKNWTKIEEANKGGNTYFALVVVPCSED